MANAETPPGRLPDRTVEVVAYDPDWPARFDHERALLAEALPSALSIEHIGSTSVSGLAAKPTLDILVVVPCVDHALEAIPPLAAIGYDYRPHSFANTDDHLFFRKVVHGKRTHHLHVLAQSSPEPADYRLFREFLIACPGAAARYESAKRALAEKHRDDRAAYVDAKEPVIDELMHEARTWR